MGTGPRSATPQLRDLRVLVRAARGPTELTAENAAGTGAQL